MILDIINYKLTFGFILLALFCSDQVHGDETHKNAHKLELDGEDIRAHLKGIIENTKEKMTPIEKLMYYMKLHDYDGNDHIDGLEFLSTYIHADDRKFSRNI